MVSWEPALPSFLFLTATQEETNMATELLLKVADCSHRLHLTVKWLQVVVCQKSQVTVKGSRLLSVGYSALVMHLGTALSEEKRLQKVGKSCKCPNELLVNLVGLIILACFQWAGISQRLS